MKAIILAGGFGTRITEETHLKPKPMILIGGRPILWHILKIYSHHNVNEFIICCGYKGYLIKEYFANYFLHMSDVTFDMSVNTMEVHHKKVEPWKITLVDTGDKTMTGGRLRRVREYINDETFCFTYGDGVADIDISALIKHHHSQGLKATVTTVRPPGRYGSLQLDDKNLVKTFKEKPIGDDLESNEGWINGGFFVLEPSVVDFIDSDESMWENEPLKKLAKIGQLSAFKHSGFWQPMDTLRDKNLLEEKWQKGIAPWKVW